MTISYSDDVATARNIGTFLRLLLRWEGSVYKVLWKDFLGFLFIYYFINVIYIFGLNEEHRESFQALVKYCAKYKDLIPLSFVLGFFVSLVMTRWWDQYCNIPWPTGIAVYVSSTLHGQDEVGRAMRRTIMRYVCLSLTMVFRVLSPRIKKRFPRMSDLIGAGLLNENELQIMEDLDAQYPNYSKNWLPIVWAATIVTKAREEGRIRDDFAMKTIHQELNNFRGSCGMLMNYNWISIPLVYTQVVIIAVYMYFLAALIGQQPKKADLGGLTLDNIPFMIMIQYLFYMGWMKVAETMMNPFGEDDDDFEINFLIDRNLQMSYLIVDDMHNQYPELVKDQYWDKMPSELPDGGKTLMLGQEKEHSEPRDIADYTVVPKTSIMKRRATFSIKKNTKLSRPTEDIEAPKSSTNPDLIPRSSVTVNRRNLGEADDTN